VPRFPSYDSTQLAFQVVGAGPPLVCLPGGPARASSYLNDLGGLRGERTLVLLDQRGTGESATPEDPESYRCDRLVDDVEALRCHLGLHRMDLLAHSAAGDIALLYAARFPHRLSHLALITPGTRAVDLEPVGTVGAVTARSTEWWYATAKAALEALQRAIAAGARSEELTPHRLGAAPFLYGRWDERARAHAEAETEERSHPGTDGYYAGFAPDQQTVRANLADLDVPVLIVAGERDINPTPTAAAALAALFPRADLAVQPGAGHFPWLDDPAAFARILLRFLDC
jgi:pimeloyl-ACP methyl ester carboxylesterase